jgi:hypothetical protein
VTYNYANGSMHDRDLFLGVLGLQSPSRGWQVMDILNASFKKFMKLRSIATAVALKIRDDFWVLNLSPTIVYGSISTISIVIFSMLLKN